MCVNYEWSLLIASLRWESTRKHWEFLCKTLETTKKLNNTAIRWQQDNQDETKKNCWFYWLQFYWILRFATTGITNVSIKTYKKNHVLENCHVRSPTASLHFSTHQTFYACFLFLCSQADSQKLAAIDLLNRRADEFRPVEVLEKLPNDWSLSIIAPALIKMTKASTHRVIINLSCTRSMRSAFISHVCRDEWRTSKNRSRKV